MTHIKFILNPTADHGHADRLDSPLRQAVEQQARDALGDQLPVITWVRTERPRHAIELARAAADEGCELVVAVGGDGTVHEVINGLMAIPAERRPRLGVIPIGSGNDFAHNVGVAMEVEQAVANLFAGRVRRIDTALISDDQGRSEYWNNTLGIGFSGIVNIISRRMTRLRGFLIYFAAVLQTILFHSRRLQAEIRLDDSPPLHETINMLSICNGPREGGGFPVAPDARMDDGLLTYMIMRGLGRPGLLYFLPIVLNARHLRYPRHFVSGTAERLVVSTDVPMIIHGDGEIFAGFDSQVRRIEVRVLPGTLEVLCCAERTGRGTNSTAGV
ncbi:MAG: diacylglycerol kinase family lipid kinase [Anaerolineae bacterium]